MRDKLHRIVDLCFELENGVTHSMCTVVTSNGFLSVTVWEGEELNDSTKIYEVFTWIDGDLAKEEEINDVIRALEDLLEEQKSWEG